MHESIDTELTDAYEELFWSDDHKILIRDQRSTIYANMINDRFILKFFKQHYFQWYHSFEDFVRMLTDRVIIAAENGADKVFDKLYKSFSNSSPLPKIYPHHNNISLDLLETKISSEIIYCIYQEYYQEHLYEHFYEDYNNAFNSYEEFISTISKMVWIGMLNEMNKEIKKSYLTMVAKKPFLILRRYPKRLKA